MIIIYKVKNSINIGTHEDIMFKKFIVIFLLTLSSSSFANNASWKEIISDMETHAAIFAQDNSTCLTIKENAIKELSGLDQITYLRLSKLSPKLEAVTRHTIFVNACVEKHVKLTSALRRIGNYKTLHREYISQLYDLDKTSFFLIQYPKLQRLQYTADALINAIMELYGE